MIQPDNNYLAAAASTPSDAFSNGATDETASLLSKSVSFLARVIRTTGGLQGEQQRSSLATNCGPLEVEPNDVVVIDEYLEDGLLLVRSDQQHGRLPAACCQILDDSIPSELCQYLVDNQLYELHVCFASFVAQDVGDLSVTKGDIIVALGRVNEHWMQGQVCFDSQSNCWPKLTLSQQSGTFPLNHCWLLDADRVKSFCHDKVTQNQPEAFKQARAIPSRPPFTFPTHSSSLSSGSSSLHSTDYQQQNQQQHHMMKPPPRPQQLPHKVTQQVAIVEPIAQRPALLTSRQHDKLKGWLQTVKKKTARLSTRITASLGLISLTRDEEFERHYENFKHIEKTIRTFVKNLNIFVEHFENFLLALQNTSEHLSDFYRDKSHQKELDELRRKNKALACEHFHAFKRTVDRQVIAVASQLLQKFSGPHQLISKRSVKLLDYDTRTKEIESCRDLDKKATLREDYVIAKDLYERINRQLIGDLPIFNQHAIDIFRECILVLLESRRNLINSYTKQTASLLDTPLMMTYTASDVASSILTSCDVVKDLPFGRHSADLNGLMDCNRKDSGQTSGRDTKPNSANDEDTSRPHSAASKLSSEFDQLALAAREISSTPISQVSGSLGTGGVQNYTVRFDEPDGDLNRSSSSGVVPADRTVGPLSSSRRAETGDELNAGNTSTNQSSPARKDYSKERRKKKCQIYVASWPFVATGPNQLTITCKQPIKLIKACDECGNPDWSLVQDKKGMMGYVPSSYIKRRD